MWAILSRVLVLVGFPLLCSSQIDSHPSENVLYQHCSTMYNRLTINFLNHFKCFYGIETGFQEKTNYCTLLNWFFHYNLWHRQNGQVTSHHEYVPHWEWFELKLGMCREEGLLTNFPKFHVDSTTSTMFSQYCRKTYRTDLVIYLFCIWKNLIFYNYLR